jgi:hypothetical protein
MHHPGMEGQRIAEPISRAPRFRDERLRVRRWRREQFYELGFTSSDAVALARSDADLNDTRKLLRSGCEHKLAFRLVR